MALVLVIGSSLVLMMFATAALTYAVGSRPLSRHDQDYNAAYSAAQAGIADYTRHLNADDSYWQTPDCDNNALVGGVGGNASVADGNPPNCASDTVGWVPVNSGDSPDGPGPKFHYDIDTSTLSDGAITVTSTGYVNGVTRTLQATVTRDGPTTFVYFTNFEDADPANASVYSQGEVKLNQQNPNCVSQYWWNGRSSNDNYCVEISFVTGDKIDGPVDTNDQPQMDGSPEFGDTFETATPGCASAQSSDDYQACWHSYGWSASPIFDKAPAYHRFNQIPQNPADLAKDPGCHYVGQTRIKFDAASPGWMYVWSKNTTSSNSTTTADCGGSNPNDAHVKVPTGGVIYASNDSDVTAHQCQPDEIGDGLPIDGDETMTTKDQYCGNGNIYIEGTLGGRVTVGAENSIVITGDLLLDHGTSGTDILGLVAGNSVEVMHPWIATTVVDTGTCLEKAWQETAGGFVSGKGYGTFDDDYHWGWKEGYFSNSGDDLTWHDGGWSSTSSSSKYFWQGATSTPSSSSRGGFVSKGKNGADPQNGEVWQGGTWTQDADGNMTYTPGSWVPQPYDSHHNPEYWQGESWSQTGPCVKYKTKTTEGESSTWPHTSSADGIQIQASILTENHSFWVQNYDEGSAQGKLEVTGSIAQNYRGIVGQGGAGGTGYLKAYTYDQRLRTQAPPYFPQWANAEWGSTRIGELTPRYGGSG